MAMKFSGMKNMLLGISLLALVLLAGWEIREAGRDTEGKNEKEAPFSLQYGQGAAKQRVKGFYSEETLYFCLPGYVQAEEVRLQMGRRQELLLEPEEEYGETAAFGNGDALSGIVWGKSYLMEMRTEGKETEYTQVVFMRGSDIPTLRLETASGSMDHILSQKGNYESGYMQVVDADGRTDCVARVDSIAGRGNTSWDAEKKSFIVKLNEEEELLGMGAAKSWVLCANYYDGAYIRNQIGFELAAAGGIAYACDSRFAELYINDEYMGLYQVMEKIQTGKNRMDIGDKYLLEIDYRDRAAKEAAGVMLSNDQPIVIHAPEKDRDEAGVQQFFDEFSRRMEEGEVPAEKMDMVSFAKMFVMEDILQDMDFGYTSHYMYLDLENEILYDGPVWDMDNTMGRGIAKEAEPLFVIDYDLNYNNLSRWYARLYGQEEFCRMAEEEYREHFRPMLARLAGGGARERVQALQASIDMDAKRFTGARSVFMEDASLEEHVEYLEHYLTDKLAVMDACYTEDLEEKREAPEFPALERQEADGDEEEQPEEADREMGIAEFAIRYRFPFILLVICSSGVILWYRRRP